MLLCVDLDGEWDVESAGEEAVLNLTLNGLCIVGLGCEWISGGGEKREIHRAGHDDEEGRKGRKCGEQEM